MELHADQLIGGRPVAAAVVGGSPRATNSLGMRFVPIAPGEFMMGEGGRPKKTRIAHGFCLAATVVTQQQWKALMGTEPWKGQLWVEEGDDYPATYVVWDDAVTFCKKLSAKENRKYRLPAEAEWEYACRAGSTTAYCFGDDESELGDYAWYYKNAWDAGEKYAHQVAQKKPNAWGLFDMHGNVWEWCMDYYDDKKQSRVLRGGGWHYAPGLCLAAYRVDGTPDLRNRDVGFRVCLDLD